VEDMDEIVREFLIESSENLDQLDQDLVALESTPGSRELLGSIFRTIHTIKGTSGFLAFGRLEKVTHAGESLLVELRDGRRTMDLEMTDVLLRLVDTVREILTAIDHDGTEGTVAVDEVIAAIVAVQERGSAPVVEPAPAAAVEPVVVEPVVEAPAAAAVVPEPVAAPVVTAAVVAEPVVTAPAVTAPVATAPVVAAPVAAEPVVDAPVVDAPVVPAPVAAVPVVVETPALEPSHPVESLPEAAAPEETLPEPVIPEEVVPVATVPEQAPRPPSVPQPRVPEHVAVPAAAPAAPPVPPAAAPPTSEEGGPRTSAESSIRVDVDLLDALMRQVGELVLARNQISRLASGTDDVDLARTAQRLNLIAGELQEGVMKTRMQPIDHVWSKMPRVVRDLAALCGREVQLEMVGGDTELDRGLLEAVKDPLTHLVRNAVDHGIESPADRTAAGKPAKGLLTLRAYHAGGQVVVEVADDGRGLDHEKIAAKAIERGIRTADQLALMSPAEVNRLLFLPGFSTAETVTNVSGRGVGMDVVRTKIEGIGGTVDVETTLGQGTVWRLRIPLTLAIMPALTVECSGDLYAVPQVNLLELVALDAQRSDSVIEYVHSAPVYRLRGSLLPLVSLAAVLQVGPAVQEGVGNQVIAVVQADQQRFGLLVDRVLNTEEIVVKPLSSRLKTIGAYAGATVLGDGHVALILDVQALSRRALVGEVDLTHEQRALDEAMRLQAIEQVLLVGIGGGRRVAMPLASVARLEHVRIDQVELVGGREVDQYRGTILPLARLDRVLGASSGYGGFGSDGLAAEAPEELLLVVYSEDGRSVGLVVEEIIDIVDDDASRHSDIEDSGLVGSTVLGEHVTELLDVRSAVLAADPAFYDVRFDEHHELDGDGGADGISDGAALERRDDLVGASR